MHPLSLGCFNPTSSIQYLPNWTHQIPLKNEETFLTSLSLRLRNPSLKRHSHTWWIALLHLLHPVLTDLNFSFTISFSLLLSLSHPPTTLVQVSSPHTPWEPIPLPFWPTRFLLSSNYYPPQKSTVVHYHLKSQLKSLLWRPLENTAPNQPNHLFHYYSLLLRSVWPLAQEHPSLVQAFAWSLSAPKWNDFVVVVICFIFTPCTYYNFVGFFKIWNKLQFLCESIHNYLSALLPKYIWYEVYTMQSIIQFLIFFVLFVWYNRGSIGINSFLYSLLPTRLQTLQGHKIAIFPNPPQYLA